LIGRSNQENFGAVFFEKQSAGHFPSVIKEFFSVAIHLSNSKKRKLAFLKQSVF